MTQEFGEIEDTKPYLDYNIRSGLVLGCKFGV